MMDALYTSDEIERATITRITDIYGGALNKALKNKRQFLKKIADLDNGKVKPPRYYVELGKEDEWRQLYVRKLMREMAVIDGIMDELNAAGVDAEKVIQKGLVDIYDVNRGEAVQHLTLGAGEMGVRVSFAQYDKRQIDIIVRDEQSPFTKLAYKNLGSNPGIRRKLQNELAMATILGESQEKLISRIRKITGQTAAQARRVAQTERTRVQSQARWQAGKEAADMGIRVYNTWSTRMVNSREAHIERNGKSAMQGDCFPGSVMKYPGDPAGGPAEVINCHCVLVPGVLRDDEYIDDFGNVRGMPPGD